MKMVMVLLFMTFIRSVYAYTVQCGGATYDIDVDGYIEPYWYEHTILTITNGMKKSVKRFDSKIFRIGCKKSPANKFYIVYQAYPDCEDQACNVLDNYWGIVDPSSLVFLLEPSNDNHEKAEKIFGGVLRPFTARKRHRHVTP